MGSTAFVFLVLVSYQVLVVVLGKLDNIPDGFLLLNELLEMVEMLQFVSWRSQRMFLHKQ